MRRSEALRRAASAALNASEPMTAGKLRVTSRRDGAERVRMEEELREDTAALAVLDEILGGNDATKT